MKAPGPIRCTFSAGLTVRLHACAACGDNRRKAATWRPPFYFFARVHGGTERGPFPPRSRVCRTHTLRIKRRHEAPILPDRYPSTLPDRAS